MLTRTFSGLIYIFLIFICSNNIFSDFLYTYFNIKINAGLLFYILNSLFLLCCLVECIKLLKYSTFIYKLLTIAVVFILYYYSSIHYFNHSFYISSLYIRYLLTLLLFFLSIVTIFKYSNELYSDSSKLIFVLAYLGVPFGLSLALPNSYRDYTSEVFYIFLLIWVSDSFAYLIGGKFGKRKLSPKISPNKSIEGLLGGIFFTLVAGILIEYNLKILKGNWIVISLLISIFAPIGDLAESKLKRVFKVKDSGKLMPGHGGLLDRLDSYIICVPVVFTYYLILSKI